jgi:hypothetical protein
MERKIGIVSENIRALDRRAELVTEQADVCLTQLCRMIADTAGNVYDAWERFNRSVTKPCTERKVALCRALCSDGRLLSGVDELLVFGDGEELATGAKRKIAYVRNKRNHKIFLDFSDEIGGARAHYATSFSDACEAVFNGVCEYSIIPIENSSEGRLYSFYSMIDRYEMKIQRVIKEYNEDASQSVTFALVSKNLSLMNREQGTVRFEFSVTNDSADFASQVIDAVKFLGGRTVDVGTLPVPYDEPRRKFYFTVDIEGAGAIALAIYMSLEYVGYSPVGFYKI